MSTALHPATIEALRGLLLDAHDAIVPRIGECDPLTSYAINKAANAITRAIALLPAFVPPAFERSRDLYASAHEVERMLTFAFEGGGLPDDTIKGLCVDPWGMLRDFRRALLVPPAQRNDWDQLERIGEAVEQITGDVR